LFGLSGRNFNRSYPLILADKNTDFFGNEEFFVNSFKNKEIKNILSFISSFLFFG